MWQRRTTKHKEEVGNQVCERGAGGGGEEVETYPFFEDDHVFKLVLFSVLEHGCMLSEKSIAHILKFRSCSWKRRLRQSRQRELLPYQRCGKKVTSLFPKSRSVQNKRENLVRFPDSLTDGYLLKLVDDSVEKYAFFVPPNTSKEKETERGERECGKVTNKRKCGVLSAQIDGAYAAEHWLLGPQMQEQCPSTSLACRTSCCVNYPARKKRRNANKQL